MEGSSHRMVLDGHVVATDRGPCRHTTSIHSAGSALWPCHFLPLAPYTSDFVIPEASKAGGQKRTEFL